MKKLIFILVLLASCSNDGIETVKTTDGLKVQTERMINTIYPDYESGDTVVIWRAYMSNDWHISVITTECISDDELDMKKHD